MKSSDSTMVEIVSDSKIIRSELSEWRSFLHSVAALRWLSRDPAWLLVLKAGLRHTPFMLCAKCNSQIVGLLPLALVEGPFFGRHLVSLPYLNSGGVVAHTSTAGYELLETAIQMSTHYRARLELRHESPLNHPMLQSRTGHKVHMRRTLPQDSKDLWKSIGSSVRNQVRKGEKSGLTVHWGGLELLSDFYTVFSHNMRDLGTPVYGRPLFEAILSHYGPLAELCLVRSQSHPVAAALLLHGHGVTEVPSASSIRKYNPLCPNMLMYWNLLDRACQRGQVLFDFGRSTPDSATYRFKKQWGASPDPADWQWVCSSTNPLVETDRSHPRFAPLTRIWQTLPVPLTRLLGPPIVRGIP